MKRIFYLFMTVTLLATCDSGGDSNLMATPTGKGGSMARFALGTNHLYVVDNNAINVYEIADNGALTKVNTVDIGFGIETIFVRSNKLFIGARDAMYIYDISTPTSPQNISHYSHIVSCDPVVVNGNYAYVTLRVRNECHAAGNDALEIINIEDLSAPYLLKSYEVETPYGLGVDGNTLFLCEGDHGVNIYDVSNPLDISLIKKYSDIHAYDVIPNNGVFIMTGNDGIFQYNYSDPSNIQLLSHIAIQ
jgi:hypothetical protein